MQNTVTAGQYSIIARLNNRPYSNNFTQLTAKVVTYNNTDYLLAEVLCTANSKEPGRIYAVLYSTQGVMQSCNTLN